MVFERTGEIRGGRSRRMRGRRILFFRGVRNLEIEERRRERARDCSKGEVRRREGWEGEEGREEEGTEK